MGGVGGEIARRVAERQDITLERARALIAQEAIVRQAQERAQEVTSQAQIKARELRSASHSYSDKMLGDAEEALTEALKSVKTTRSALRSASSGNRLKG